MIYYTYDLPHIDHGYMTEKAVKAVMDEISPCQIVDFGKLTEDELDEYISAWLSGSVRDVAEEFIGDAIMSDTFFIDTALSLWTDPLAYATEIKKRSRDIFTEPRPATDMNPLGLSLAHRLEADVNAVLEHEGVIDQDEAA